MLFTGFNTLTHKWKRKCKPSLLDRKNITDSPRCISGFYPFYIHAIRLGFITFFLFIPLHLYHIYFCLYLLIYTCNIVSVYILHNSCVSNVFSLPIKKWILLSLFYFIETSYAFYQSSHSLCVTLFVIEL